MEVNEQSEWEKDVIRDKERGIELTASFVFIHFPASLPSFPSSRQDEVMNDRRERERRDRKAKGKGT